MFRSRYAFIFQALFIITACTLSMAQAETSQGTTQVSTRHSFLDPIEDFTRDSILHPVVPCEIVPGKDPHGWSFVIEPYLWALGLSGKTGIGGFPAAEVNVDARRILQQLDWGIMGMGEVRKGRWGVLADGYYAQLSGSSELESVLYESGDLTLQQGLASLALAFRIIDDRRGFLDLYLGARYNYLGAQVDTKIDAGEISEIANEITERLAAGINARLSQLLTSQKDLSATDLQTLAQSVIYSRILEKMADTPRSIRELIRNSKLRHIFDSHRDVFLDYIATQAALSAAAAKGKVSSALQARANAAKQKLSRKIAKDIEDALPTSGVGSQWWIDPIIGLRGQVNFTRWLFFAAQADVGGFGVGSQIAWNIQAAFGVNVTRNVFAELGYRYMYVDYDKNNFLYQMNSFGIFSSFGVKF